MTDLINRADAMGAVQDHFNADGFKGYDDGQKMMDRIKALPSADAEPKWNCTASFVAEQLERLRNMTDEEKWEFFRKFFGMGDAVQGWRIGKPTEQGEYTVTVKSMRGGMVESLYYGKPIMPNRKVRGKCWYRSDDEWGDVVYDDSDILAWQPLPTPYKGGDDE